MKDWPRTLECQITIANLSETCSTMPGSNLLFYRLALKNDPFRDNFYCTYSRGVDSRSVVCALTQSFD